MVETTNLQTFVKKKFFPLVWIVNDLEHNSNLVKTVKQKWYLCLSHKLLNRQEVHNSKIICVLHSTLHPLTIVHFLYLSN